MNNFFKVSKRESSYSKEILSGVIVFISMFYIIPVQGGMLGDFSGTSSSTIGIVTAITAGIATISMGLITNYPIALASGMGVNAFIAYTLLASSKMSFESAMSAVLISGLLFILVSVTQVRARILKSIPEDIKKAISIGVGFFLMFVALTNTGIIIKGTGTPTTIGMLNEPMVVLGFISIFLSIIFWIYNIRGGVLISMIITIIIGLLLTFILNSNGLDSNGLPSLKQDWSNYGKSFNDIDKIFGSSIFGLADIKNSWVNPTWYLAILTIFLNTFFDASGTLFGLNDSIDKIAKADEKTSKKIITLDATSTTLGSIFGSTSVTIFAESIAGVNSGARTGFSSIVTGSLFLITIPIIPILQPLFTSSITSGAIVLIGIFMSSKLSSINVKDKVYLTSTISTIIFMFLGYSIGIGIVFGLLTFIILMIFSKRYKELDWILLASSPLLIIFLILPIFI